jgi:ABC-type uncharacterized transport system involved in gliding motility auxiliary subunit
MMIRNPLWLRIGEFDISIPVTAALNEMALIQAGSFGLAEGAEGVELTPWIESSEQSGEVLSFLANQSNPQMLAQNLDPDGERRVLAGMVTGTFKTAFPEGKPAALNATGEPTEADAEPSLQESAEPGTIVIVTDADFIYDAVTVQIQPFIGTQIVQQLNDNLNFVENVVDFLSGSEDLILLRGTGSNQRTFTLVDQLEQQANEAYLAEYEAVQGERNEVQARLRDLMAQQTDEGRGVLVASPEIMEQIETFRAREIELRNREREISKVLREDVEATEMFLALMNLIPLPVGIIAIGVFFFLTRNRR